MARAAQRPEFWASVVAEARAGEMPLDEAGQTPWRQRVLHEFKAYLRCVGLKEWSFHAFDISSLPS